MPSDEKLPLLVVAALSYELEKLKSISNPQLVLVETGEGVANARRELERWIESNKARAVLSVGFAGALSASLRIADIVVAREVKDSQRQPDAKLLSAAEKLSLDKPMKFALAVTSNEILWQAESKRAFGASLPPSELGFVDMESTAIADVCGTYGIPFLIVRAITDLLDEDLPVNFNLCRDEDGRVNSTKVLKATLRNPSAMKGLLELRKRSTLCAQRIAEFVLRFSEMI